MFTEGDGAGAPDQGQGRPIGQPRRSLSRHLSELQALLDQAPSFLLLTQGPSHVVAIANSAYLRLVGRKREDVVGRSIVEAIPELTEQGLLALLDEAVQTEKQRTGAAVKVRLSGANGLKVERRVDFLLQPIFDATSKTAGVVVQGLDVTDRELAIEALQLADRNKDIFLATLAHEMLTPLSACMSALDLLGSMLGKDNVGARKSLQVLVRQLPLVATLVEDLLDVARIKLGKIKLNFEDVAIQEVVRFAVEMCQHRIDAHGHQLRIQAPEQAIIVRADRRRMVQVLSNLLMNASKFTAPGGHIEIEVRPLLQFVEIVVTDDGRGMTSEQATTAFRLFHQNSELDSKHGGLGIGLALVQQLVELQGGTVLARSSGLNHGSSFIVQLRLIVDNNEPEPSAVIQ